MTQNVIGGWIYRLNRVMVDITSITWLLGLKWIDITSTWKVVTSKNLLIITLYREQS
jgi:hypothetical protein